MREAKEAGAGGVRRGDRYLPQFKERVVSYAKNHTFLETARKFNVHNTTVSDWVRDHDNKHKPTEEADAPELRDTGEGGSSWDTAFKEWLLASSDDSLDRDTLVRKAEEAVAAAPTASDWFTAWLCRLKEETKRERSCAHLHYPPWFKTAVCAFARHSNSMQVAKLFGLSRRTVGVWVKAAADHLPATHTHQRKKKTGGSSEGRAVTDSDIDKQLLKVKIAIVLV